MKRSRGFRIRCRSAIVKSRVCQFCCVCLETAPMLLGFSIKVIAHALLPPDGLPCGSPSLEARGQDGIGGNGIEVLWGEVFADPLLLIGIVGMVRVGQNFQEMLVAPGSAAIFWGTGAFPGDAERIGLPVES